MTPVVHIAGPRGVGSSTVAFSLYTLVVGDGHRTGYVDLSQLRFATPTPSPAAVQRNLAALWQGHRDAGATSLIVTGPPGARLSGATLVWLTADHTRRLAATATPRPRGVDLEVDTNALTARETARRIRRRLPPM